MEEQLLDDRITSTPLTRKRKPKIIFTPSRSPAKKMFKAKQNLTGKGEKKKTASKETAAWGYLDQSDEEEIAWGHLDQSEEEEAAAPPRSKAGKQSKAGAQSKAAVRSKAGKRSKAGEKSKAGAQTKVGKRSKAGARSEAAACYLDQSDEDEAAALSEEDQSSGEDEEERIRREAREYLYLDQSDEEEAAAYGHLDHSDNEDIRALLDVSEIEMSPPQQAEENHNNSFSVNSKLTKTHFKLNVPLEVYVQAGLKTTVSDMGKLMPVYKSNVFTCDRIAKNGRVYYHKCQLAYSGKCRGRLSVHNCGKVEESGIHSHAPEPAVVNVRKVRSTIKFQALTTEKSTKELYSHLRTLDEESLSQAPKAATTARYIQRHRDPVNNVNAPKTKDFQIPDRFLRNKAQEEWIAFDTGKEDPERIIGFATLTFLTLMFSATHLFADGTFSVAPSLYFQLLTIHGIVMDTASMPLLYVLLANKKGNTYNRLMELVKNCLPGKIFKPKSFMVDFELGLSNSIEKACPTTKLSFCFFHLCQSMWRNVQDKGLSSEYLDNKEFCIFVKSLCALAFVPVKDVVRLFEQLTLNLEEKHQKIADYFEWKTEKWKSSN